MTTIVKRVGSTKEGPDTVYIGRPSKWGNPFIIGKDGTRAEVVMKYREWIATQPELLLDLWELKDKTLLCWCSPLPCHGHVLAELANRLPGEKRMNWPDHEKWYEEDEEVGEQYSKALARSRRSSKLIVGAAVLMGWTDKEISHFIETGEQPKGKELVDERPP